LKIISAIILFLIISVITIPGDDSGVYRLFLKVFPQNYNIYIEDELYEPVLTSGNTQEYLIPGDAETAFLRSNDYLDRYLFSQNVEFTDSNVEGRGLIDILELKLERSSTALKYNDILGTGSQPKSVEFSPDGDYIAVALLNGEGVEIYSLENMELYSTLIPPEKWSKKKGFVETVFFTTRNELWVSQMTTGLIHVFDTEKWIYIRSFFSGGLWPKVITLNKNEDKAYISNWLSQNISVVDTKNYEVKITIEVNGVPRGMAVSPDEKYLYVANFTSGDINKISLDSNKLVDNIDLGDGALRHIVISEDSNMLYVADMYYGKVTSIDISTDKVKNSFYAGSNVNTIKLSPSGTKLFISSRGRNSENGYLHKGPEFGKIFMYDTLQKKITDWTWGGNQPTGLAISPDGKMLVFTDFLDDRVEVYNIQSLSGNGLFP
jgi:YVTN family beta-propeller protein